MSIEKLNIIIKEYKKHESTLSDIEANTIGTYRIDINEMKNE